MNNLKYNDFLKVCKQIKTAEITMRACLGYSSKSIFIHGTDRRYEVSIRNHSSMYSMLITDTYGHFLFNGGVANITKHTPQKAASIAYFIYKEHKADLTF